MDQLEEQPNQSLDDDYLLLLHEKLKNAKEQRKKCELDNEILEGRVKCLKNEEEKTLKKIERTQKKTREKVLDIERHNQEKIELEKIKEQRLIEHENQKRKNIEQKFQRDNLKNMKNEMIRNNQEEAKIYKQKTQEDLKYLNFRKNEDINQKRNVVDYIKSQHFLNEERKRAIELEKKNAIQIDLEDRIQLEIKIKEENEAKIGKLEQEEQEIMAKINNITRMHKQLVMEFQKLFNGDMNYEDNYDPNYNNSYLEPSLGKSHSSSSYGKLPQNSNVNQNANYNYA